MDNCQEVRKSIMREGMDYQWDPAADMLALSLCHVLLKTVPDRVSSQ